MRANPFISAIIKIKRKFEMSKYNDFTIAEFFRKQGAQIGNGCNIQVRSFGTEPYLIKIGNNVGVMAGVNFHTHDGGTWIFRSEIPDLRVFGPIIIHDNCLIGSNSHILPNVNIGANSIVGANSVVISDVKPNSIVMGVPARRFGSIEKYKEKCIERWAEQKPPGLEINSIKNYELSSEKEFILSELEKHLKHVFRDRLK